MKRIAGSVDTTSDVGTERTITHAITTVTGTDIIHGPGATTTVGADETVNAAAIGTMTDS